MTLMTDNDTDGDNDGELMTDNDTDAGVDDGNDHDHDKDDDDEDDALDRLGMSLSHRGLHNRHERSANVDTSLLALGIRAYRRELTSVGPPRPLDNAPCPKRSLTSTLPWGSLEDHPQTPHKHLSLAQTLPQHPDARDSARALALGAKANGGTTRRVGNAGGKRSHASRTSGCPGELSSTSSAQAFIYICRLPTCREERRLDASPQRQRCLCLEFVGIDFRPE